MEHNAAQRYLNQVSRFLVCAGGDRKRLLGRCRELADSFQQENPDAEYDGFVSAFGKPADCAAELLSTLDASAIESAQKKRRWLHRIELFRHSAHCYISYQILTIHNSFPNFLGILLFIVTQCIR